MFLAINVTIGFTWISIFNFIHRHPRVAWRSICLAVLPLLNVPVVFVAKVALSITKKLEERLELDVDSMFRVRGGEERHMPGGRGPECNVELICPRVKHGPLSAHVCAHLPSVSSVLCFHSTRSLSPTRFSSSTSFFSSPCCASSMC